jgi:ankyrin repeat protein
MSYQSDANLFDRPYEPYEQEALEVWDAFQREPEAASVRRAYLTLTSERLAMGATLGFHRGADGLWKKGMGFMQEDVATSEECCACATESPSLDAKENPSLAEAALWGDVAEAALWGDVGRLRELIDAGEDFDRKDELGGTPLLYALFRGESRAAQLLIDAGADPNATSRPARPFGGFTALIIVAFQGNDAMVDWLIAAGAIVNGRTEEGYTALGAASKMGHRTVVRLLLAQGAEVDPTYDAGVTPLMLASQEGRGTVVQLLLATGANPSLTDAEGKTALHHAVEGRQSWREAGSRRGDCRLAIIYGLLSFGVDPNARDTSGKTALDLATEAQDSELVELLTAFERS